MALILGHGMSPVRSAARTPERTSARVADRLNNMCPTLVFRGGRPAMVMGASRRETHSQHALRCVGPCAGPRSIARRRGHRAAIAHRRRRGLANQAKGWTDEQIAYLKHVGYTIEPGALEPVSERHRAAPIRPAAHSVGRA